KNAPPQRTELQKDNVAPPPQPDRPEPPGLARSAAEERHEMRSRRQFQEVFEQMLKSIGKDSAALRRAEADLSRRPGNKSDDWLPFSWTKASLRSQLPQLNRSLRFDQILKEGELFFRSHPAPVDMGDWHVGRSGRGGSSSGGLAQISAAGAGDEQG